MEFELERPLVVFDIESTGLNPAEARIIDLAAVKLHPNGEQETFTVRVHPGIPIPPGATAVHGITDADVAGCPSFSGAAARVLNFLADCDLAGFNIIRYDLPLLLAEYRRAGLTFDLTGRRVVDAYQVFRKRELRTLSAALAFYCGEEHRGAHGALSDVEATIKVLAGQVRRYEDLPRDLDALHAYCSLTTTNTQPNRPNRR